MYVSSSDLSFPIVSSLFLVMCTYNGRGRVWPQCDIGDIIHKIHLHWCLCTHGSFTFITLHLGNFKCSLKSCPLYCFWNCNKRFLSLICKDAVYSTHSDVVNSWHVLPCSTLFHPYSTIFYLVPHCLYFLISSPCSTTVHLHWRWTFLPVFRPSPLQAKYFN